MPTGIGVLEVRERREWVASIFAAVTVVLDAGGIQTWAAARVGWNEGGSLPHRNKSKRIPRKILVRSSFSSLIAYKEQ